ncbi:NAD-dependent epimerase/dehydratase family protein [Candidatus Peregrinibacteria bacterium]|nr:NAD-dependent epimerase/dehydratase family protein [Candidatus Peregrinibacteria bacterium]MBI5732369.1 NAD-dependent epimerase/dehydratase family protein [Candidatus Jorgensenbacteria bacterium]
MELKDKKILITGGSGFLGSAVISELLKQSVPHENIFAPRSSEYDLRLLDSCKSVVKDCDLVIHLAGVTGNTEFHRTHPAKIFYDNLMMGIQLMNAAREAKVKKFVSAGSVAEYPENAPVPFREDDLWSGFPELTHGPYAVAKRLLLVQGQAYRSQYNFNAIHLLFTNMYGPGESLKWGFVIPSIIKKIWESKKEKSNYIDVWGTGKPTRDFLYVKDAARAVILALRDYEKSDPVNIGSGKEISVRELVTLIAKLSKFEGEIRFDASKPDGHMRRLLDTTRAKSEFGFAASTDFEDGLKETIAWHLKDFEL